MNLKDKLNNTPPIDLAVHTATMMDKLQDLPADAQVQASAVMFVLLCEETGVRPADICQQVERMMLDGDRKYRPEFNAARMYIQSQMLGMTL